MIASGIAGIMVAAALFFVVNVLEGPFFSFSTKTWPAEVRDGKVIGGIQGPVKDADGESGTVRVASGFLGFASTPVVVTPQTQIAVNGKLGGFADLDRGQLIRVAYEVFPDRLVATRVDVLDRMSSSSDTAVLPSDRESAPSAADPTAPIQRALQPGAAPVSGARPLAPPAPERREPESPASAPSASPFPAPEAPGAGTPPTALPSGSPTALPAPVSPWTAAPPVSATTASVPTKRVVVPPNPPPRISAETPRPAPAPAVPTPRTSMSAPTASAPPPARRAVTPGTSQEDGGAVIDWLLKKRGQ